MTFPASHVNFSSPYGLHNSQMDRALHGTTASSSGGRSRPASKEPLFGMKLHDQIIRNKVHTQFATQWYNLALELGLEGYETSIIDKNHPCDIEGACSDMLRRWCEKFDASATVSQLCLSLQTLGLNGVSKTVEELLNDSNRPVTANSARSVSADDYGTMNRKQLTDKIVELENLVKFYSSEVDNLKVTHAQDIHGKVLENNGLHAKNDAFKCNLQQKDEEIAQLTRENEQLRKALSSQSATTLGSRLAQMRLSGAGKATRDSSRFMDVYSSSPEIGNRIAQMKFLNRNLRLFPVQHWDEIASELGVTRSNVNVIRYDTGRDAIECLKKVFGKVGDIRSATYRDYALAIYNVKINKGCNPNEASEVALDMLYAG